MKSMFTYRPRSKKSCITSHKSEKYTVLDSWSTSFLIYRLTGKKKTKIKIKVTIKYEIRLINTKQKKECLCRHGRSGPSSYGSSMPAY